MGCKLYNGGEMFYSGCLVDIKDDFTSSDKINSKGIYVICSLRSDGYIQLKNNLGEILKPIHIKYLIPCSIEKIKD